MLFRIAKTLALSALLFTLGGCPGGEQEARCEGTCSGEDTATVWIEGRCPANDCPFIPAEADQQAKNGAQLNADNNCIMSNLNTNCTCNGTPRRHDPVCEDLIEESGNVWCVVKVKYTYDGTCAVGQ